MRFFVLLGKLLTRAQETLNANGQLPTITLSIVLNILVPNLAWYAGDKARALRTAVISCLWALFHGKLVQDQDVMKIVKVLLPNVRVVGWGGVG